MAGGDSDLHEIAIVGTGYVADLYMRSLQSFPEIRVAAAFDIDAERLRAFCTYWRVPAANSLDELLDARYRAVSLILNLTNPESHHQVSMRCLQAGKHVYSEKPLALDMDAAYALHALAKKQDLLLASAPCSLLGETAQTLWLALRENRIGKPHLVYAELDDGYVAQAPYRHWQSESGAPWPYRNEFSIGCTLEHAGYYLTWLIAMFGPVQKVIAASANLLQDKIGDGSRTAPDFSCATLFFASNVVARLTCSIIAPHNHKILVVGEKGSLEVGECWDNNAAVRLRRRYAIRRKLVNSPIAKRVRIIGPTQQKVRRRGAAAMNFALGPAELLAASAEHRQPRLNSHLALHLNEITLAIQNAEDISGVSIMQTGCPPIEPMPWARAG
jgi:predicted dehydrogenase